MIHLRSRAAACAAVLALALTGLTTSGPSSASAPAAPIGLRDVMWVGNNWDGTASIVDAHTLEVLKRGVNLIPDKQQELQDIFLNPLKLAFYLVIQVGPGEGHDQYVDDMFTTRNGKYLAVSRPSFADVIWVDIAKATAGAPGAIVREQQMDGFRTDHMGLSPDGKRLLVSDSTKKQVIEYSMVNQPLAGIKMGDRLRTFPSGETPHESNYTTDGKRVFHASIGRVYTPGETLPIDPVVDAIKSDRWFQIVRNSDFKILQRWDMRHELAEAGFPGMSPAVRPMAIAPGARFLYFQVSFFHGLVEFDTKAADLNAKSDYTLGGVAEPTTGRVTRVINLENRVPQMLLEQYVNDSAHHGLSINTEGTKLCVAGTMDDYAAIVDRATGVPTYLDEASTGHHYGKPYWTTEGLHNRCWISLSESDAVAVVDYETGEELAFLAVGNHPQRIRHGYVKASLAATW